jgi:PAS domain S-box-containing protein
MKKIIKFINEYISIFTGVLFGLVFWAVDILVDVFMLKEGTIAGNLSSPEPMEIYFRVIVGSLFVAFGVQNHFVTKKRKAIETEANKNQIRYQNLFSSMLNGFALHRIIVDAAGQPVDFEYLEANHAFEKMTGLTRKEIIGRRATEVLPGLKKDSFDWIGTYGKVALDNQKMQFEQYSQPLGKWYNITAYSPSKGEFATVLEDITERKKNENVVRENQERMDTIFNSIQAGIMVIDRETHTIAYVNEAAVKMVGYTREQLLDQQCQKYVCSAACGECPITDLGQKVDNAERVLLTADGCKLPILKTVVEIELDGRQVLVESFVDISECKLAEAALNAGAIRRRILIEQSQDGIVVLTKDGSVYESNHRFAEMIGYSPEEINQIHVWDWEFQYTREQTIDMIHNVGEAGDFFETRHRRKDGTLYDVEISTNGAIFEGEKLIFCVCRDITERKKQEKVIKEQALFFKTLVDTILNPVFYKDTEGKYLGCNKAFEELMGIPEDQIAGKTVFDLTPPDKAAQYHNMDMELLREGGIQTYEYPVKSAKQGLRGMQFNKSIFKDAKGNPKGIVGVMMDVTERNKSEKLQAAIYHISEAAISSNNIETLYGEIHKTVTELISAKNFYIALYHEKEDLLSFPYFVDEVDPAPQPRKLANGLTEYVLRSGTPLLASPVVLNLLVEQGKVNMVGTPAIDWAGVPLKVGNKTLGVLVVQSYHEDIRFGAEALSMLNFVSDNIALAIARKNDEEERKKLVSELRKLSSAVEQSTSVIVIADLEGNIEYVNPAFEKTTGYSLEETLGKNPRILKSGEMTDNEYRKLWETISAGGEWRGQFHNKRKDGSLYWEQAAISGIRDADGKVVKYLAVKEDITERKMMEDELKSSEAQNRVLVDSAGQAGEAIVMMQNTGSIPGACLVANQEAVRITGYSQEELKSISWLDVVHPRFREESQKRVQARLHNEDIPGTYEISLVSKYGVEIPVEVTGSPVQYQGRPAMVGFFREISERKQAELEREAMITELTAALANIKQLKGLIPICASCKKIRNDGGYWQQVEEYVADHTDADFSHGLCDECAHKLYPDYFADKKNEENIQPPGS